jgi:hypothetical protein
MHTNKALLNACPKQLLRQGTLNVKGVQISIEVSAFARVDKFPPFILHIFNNHVE